ncbi:MAG: guanylate kinase [Sphingomonadales bacterium RIFCSPHIGHO2_01_FULL_65_20]|jgi:guanylate kinase|uniref:guanylate kinase n=1 Tax=Blastomonas TaxID=150203 RepID=UPI000831E664|nr:guanylate kinase [Sphingomonas ursincola]MBA4779275.1 guanylate kinase [Blastomonas sp.]MBY0620943.1 guanylate kinase [Sphingomonas ursincola]MCH2236957.1 guanylate kinase [Blastomonas sp.]OHC91832.1 MAG: guanylate kinase [Sphingomonadales bacterium RIFCSPHIGHO2_01_FULL_65_20]
MINTVIQAPLARRGLLFILSSPSGAGKSTIARMLLEQDKHIALSVSVTTRPPRPGEIDGKDYHFIDEAEFHRLVEDNALLEWAKVFGHYYGTPKAQVKQGLREGQDFLFDIDWQGTQQLYQRAEGDVVRVFILPPSLEELHRRLRSRNTDSEEVIAGRMARAQDEISHWDGYDFVVINDNVENCFEKVRQILNSERMRRARQTGLIDYVRDLMNTPAP